MTIASQKLTIMTVAGDNISNCSYDLSEQESLQFDEDEAEDEDDDEFKTKNNCWGC